MHILFISRWFPHPADNGSRIRIFNLLRQLAGQHDVSLVAFHERGEQPDARSIVALLQHCSSVRMLPYRSFQPARLTALAGLPTPTPRFLVDTYSREMARAVDEEAQRFRPDLVVASQLDMVPYALGLRGVPALLEELEVTSYRDRLSHGGARSRLRAGVTWLKLRGYLRRVLPRFGHCTVVSEQERLNVLAAAPGRVDVSVLPNAVDTTQYAGPFGDPCPETAVFSGALTYAANLDAAEYLLREIYPRVLQVIPEARLRITGGHAGVDLTRLPRQSGVELTGYLPDVRPVVAQSWLSVVPLRVGGGTRLKILESMGLGTPVVSTSKGAEGLEVRDGENILLADTAESFADRCIQLFGSPRKRERLARAGRQLVSARYDWSRVGEELLALVERAAA